MLATPELMREAAQVARVEELLPNWRDVPLYQAALASGFSSLPQISKRELRENFPNNFLRAGQNLDALLESKLVELSTPPAVRMSGRRCSLAVDGGASRRSACCG